MGTATKIALVWILTFFLMDSWIFLPLVGTIITTVQAFSCVLLTAITIRIGDARCKSQDKYFIFDARVGTLGVINHRGDRGGNAKIYTFLYEMIY